MPAKIKFNPRSSIQVEIEANDPKQALRALAAYQEIFAYDICGQCQGTAIKFEHRVHDDNDFYGLRCLNPQCRAQLDFGQHKNNKTLFVKADRGWYIYRKDSHDSQQDGQSSEQTSEAYEDF